jgi:CTP:molybdopterin cytidylyltransferase MocA
VPAALLVVLAAGGGSRYEGATHKLLAPFGGETVIRCSVRAALDSGAGPVLVVSGSVDDLGLGDLDVTVRHNERWGDGQATSVQIGIAHATELGADAVVVGLGDQPLVGPDAWRLVAGAGAGPIVTASFGGERRPPVRIDRPAWPLLPTSGDEGARATMREHQDLVTAVEVPGTPVDIDTADDLVRWS